MTKIKSTSLFIRLISWLGICTFLDESLNFALKSLHISKSYAYHFYSIIELSLIAYAFFFFIKTKPPKSALFLIPIISACFGLGNLLLFQPLNVVNTNMLMVECVASIGMSLYALYYILNNDETFNVYKSPGFIIWSALLLLMTGTFFFWACFEFLLTPKSPYKMPLIIIQIIINIVVYISIAIALLINTEKIKNE